MTSLVISLSTESAMLTAVSIREELLVIWAGWPLEARISSGIHMAMSEMSFKLSIFISSAFLYFK